MKKMEENKEVKEMGVDQLKSLVHQLSEQNRALFNENKQLRYSLEEISRSDFFKRLDYLFEVIEKDNKYLSTSFKEKCANEIEILMTQVEEEPAENTEEK
jgi:hypothetical protein|uniref:Initiation-control protein YabA, DnaA, DnaN, Zinc finger.7A n=1 Tax=virus sp. ctPYc18 TaxID=2828251 RepID=A0A8S5RD01_9VIRU|nr:MAG TPA: Initiation-control protein YabA, DnaA, DnaN, Zinc finger.7A [virus sp. ctPYc18]